ncbi:hypothetical protein DEU56DRAFT_760381 [Suillus clintonianus]|uniref:uncharacterized protein n=1 Tax=Suillus clintonianus TaxID=1904413 RepID=UPI001B86801B|nr:uncharacterized protein DEU56DRAFT_760381 [Suillus clintonianus]KAG2122352.1 hypothetical protein DEU56DRAFT_760381 [Suillus clintonianus]
MLVRFTHIVLAILALAGVTAASAASTRGNGTTRLLTKFAMYQGQHCKQLQVYPLSAAIVSRDVLLEHTTRPLERYMMVYEFAVMSRWLFNVQRSAPSYQFGLEKFAHYFLEDGVIDRL